MKSLKNQIQAQFIKLHPKELALIIALRNKFPFGEVHIIMRDGVPQRIKKAWEFDDLELSTDKKFAEKRNIEYN